jgi:hypothetical protein
LYSVSAAAIFIGRLYVLLAVAARRRHGHTDRDHGEPAGSAHKLETPGDRANHARTALAVRPQELSETRPIAIDTRLRSSIWTGTCPAAVDELRQYGAEENQRLRIGEPHDESLPRCPAVTARRRRRAERTRQCPAPSDAWIPSQTRYRAPASFTTTNTAADRSTRVPMPTATATATT